jgi:diadenylate cyclase
MVWTHLPIPVILMDFLFAFIDVLIISFIFYKFYQILAQTKAVQVIKGLFFFIVLYLVSRVANLATFSWLLDQIAAVVVIAIIILFQPELRRVLTKLGQSSWISGLMTKDPKDLTAIMSALQNFQILHTGALIVFERSVGLRNIIESGTVLNAKISTSLLLTVFSNKTPLHDGAVIVKNDTVIAAGCFLPLSDSDSIRKDFGTRHRAALGLAEESDAVVVVVSEETGKISLAYDGKLYTNYEIDILQKELFNLLGYEEGTKDPADEKV